MHEHACGEQHDVLWNGEAEARHYQEHHNHQQRTMLAEQELEDVRHGAQGLAASEQSVKRQRPSRSHAGKRQKV